MLGGLLWVLFPLGTPFFVSPDEAGPPGTLVHGASLAYYWLLLVFPHLLLLLGLVSLHALYGTTYGRLGNVGFLVSFVAFVLMFVGNAWEMVTFTFQNRASDVGHLFFFAGLLALVVGSAPLGIALMRARDDPPSRIGGLLLIAILPLGILLLIGLGALSPKSDLGFWAATHMPYGLAWVLLGHALLSARSTAAEQPARVR
jgi:hypothetical protein